MCPKLLPATAIEKMKVTIRHISDLEPCPIVKAKNTVNNFIIMT